MNPLRAGIVFLLLTWSLAISAIAEAHGRSTSYITWTNHGTLATVRVKMALIDQNALEATWAQANPPRNAAMVLPEAVVLSGDGGVCQVTRDSFHELLAEHGSAAFEWQTKCMTNDGTPIVPSNIHSDLLFDVTAAHVALVRFHDMDAELEADYVLTESRRDAVLPRRTTSSSSTLSTSLRFGRAGIEHLLTGWDHLAFLLALVLASRSLRGAIVCLTGFTLGHSLTLSMAALGYAAAKTATVEALIALSIVLVSIENVWLAERRTSNRWPLISVVGLFVLAALCFFFGNISPLALIGLALFEACFLGLLLRSEHPENWRWMTATLFGLLHGFGFAGMLSQMDLPTGNRALPLASFNLGIEIAQIGVVGLAWPLIVMLRRRISQERVIAWGAAATLALGMYGCVTRFWISD